MQRIRKLSHTLSKSSDPSLDAEPPKEPGLVRKLSKVFTKSGEGERNGSLVPGEEKSGHRPRKLSISSIMSTVKASASQTSLHRTISSEKLKPVKPQEKSNHRMVLLPGQHSELKHCKSMPFQRPNKPTYKGGQPLPKDIIIRTVNTIDLEFREDGVRTSSESNRDTSSEDHSYGHEYSYAHRRLDSSSGLIQSKSDIQLRQKPQLKPQPLAITSENKNNPYGMSDVDAAFMKKTFEYLEKIGQPLPVVPHLQRTASPASVPRSARLTPSPLWDGPPRAPPRQQIPRTPPGVDFPSRSGSPDSCYSQDSLWPCPTAIDRELDKTEQALAQFWPPTPKAVTPARQLEVVKRDALGVSVQNLNAPQKQLPPTERSAGYTAHARAPSVTAPRSDHARSPSPQFHSTPPLRVSAAAPPPSTQYLHVSQARSRPVNAETTRHTPSKLRDVMLAPRLHASGIARNESSDSSHSSSRHTGLSSPHRVPKTTKISTTTIYYTPPRAEPDRAYLPQIHQSAPRPSGHQRAHTIDAQVSTSAGSRSQHHAPTRAQTHDQSRTQGRTAQPQLPTRFSPFATPNRPVVSRAPASEPSVPLCLQPHMQTQSLNHSQSRSQLPRVQTSQAERTVTVHRSSSVKEKLAAARVAEFGVIPPATAPAPPAARSSAGQSQSHRHHLPRSTQELSGRGSAYTTADYTRRAPHRM